MIKVFHFESEEDLKKKYKEKFEYIHYKGEIFRKQETSKMFSNGEYTGEKEVVYLSFNKLLYVSLKKEKVVSLDMYLNEDN